MKLTCLSKGSGVHDPPCHVLELCGFRLLLECPIDLSALNLFAPVTAGRQLDAAGFIRAVPWYKTTKNLHRWDVSLIDAVLISTPDGLLGLPFLTRNPRFSAQIYCTEATMRIGRLMMDDLVSMHSEYVHFYGREERTDFPDWLGWQELGRLPLEARKIAIGEDGEELGCWSPLYSAADINQCIERVQPLRYAEEAWYNCTLMLKAFSSGLEIGSCNWQIKAPTKNIVYLSSSIFESAQAIGFDYHSLQGPDIILFSDMASTNDLQEDCRSDLNEDDKDLHLGNASSRVAIVDDSEVAEVLMDNCESLEETDKMNFICSCVIDSLRRRGSVLIPIGRLGIMLQLLEKISDLLISPSFEVPIFMISTTAEQTLAFTNAIPEWICKDRQQKLFCGEPLFRHVELIKDKKLHVFPFLYSSKFLLTWEEPCVVFAPHWTLRMGPVLNLLDRWHADNRSLLILEEGVDAEMVLLSFKKLAIRVLQCSFLSGIRSRKIFPLLDMLQPKLVLLPDDLRPLCISPGWNTFSLLFYSVNSTVRVPSQLNNLEGHLMTDMAFQLQPKRLASKEMAIARFRGKLILRKGSYLLAPPKKPMNLSRTRLLLWGYVDAVRLLVALKDKGLSCSIERDENVISRGGTECVRIKVEEKAVIETSATRTLICTEDRAIAALIQEALCCACDGI